MEAERWKAKAFHREEMVQTNDYEVKDIGIKELVSVGDSVETDRFVIGGDSDCDDDDEEKVEETSSYQLSSEAIVREPPENCD